MADLAQPNRAQEPSRSRGPRWRARAIWLGGVLVVVVLLALPAGWWLAPGAATPPVPAATRDRGAAALLPTPVLFATSPQQTATLTEHVPATPPPPGGAGAPTATVPPGHSPATSTPPATEARVVPPATGTATRDEPGAHSIGAVVTQTPRQRSGHLTQFALAGPDQFWIVVDDALLETTDHGQHWQTRFHGSINGLSFVTARQGWIAIDNAILATSDGGQTWSPRYQTSAFVQLLGFVSPRQGWIVDGHTLRTTQDGGQTWQTLATSRPLYEERFLDALHGWGFFLPISEYGGPPELAWSQDAGRQWDSRSAPRCGWSTGGAAFSASGPHTAWIACGEVPGAGIGVRIARTSDGGLTWQQFDAAGARAPDLTIDSPGLVFLDNQHGWLGADIPLPNGLASVYLLQATADGGRTWQPRALLGPRGILFDKTGDAVVSGVLDFRFTTATRGYARYGAGPYGEDGTLLETRDGGARWTALYGPLPSPSGPMHFFDDAHGVGTGLPWESGAFLHTSDGGRTWSQLSTLTGLCAAGVLGGIRDLSFPDRNHGWALADCFLSDQAGPQILVYTSDGGATWRVRRQTLPAGASNRWWQSISFFNARSGYLASNGTIDPPIDPTMLHLSMGARTNDGGVSFRPVYTPTWPAADQLRFVSETHGWRRVGSELLATSDGGHSWQRLQAADVQDVDLHPDGAGWIIMTEPAPAWPSLLTTTDGGQTWQRYEFSHITPQRVSFADRQHGWVRDSRHLYATTDGGATWAQVH